MREMNSVIADPTRRTFNRALTTIVVSLNLVSLSGNIGAQEPTAPRRIGVLLGGLSPESKEAQEFRRGLAAAGYIEGRDVVIEWHTAGGDYDKLPKLAEELGKH
jgi:hypothetical protein